VRTGQVRSRLQRDFGGAIGRELCARSHFVRQMLRQKGNLTKLRRTLCPYAGRFELFYRVIRLFRTFVIGIFLGLTGAGALIYFAPAVDLHRQTSLMSVQPNGGNAETFRINLPRDRILVGLPGADNTIPSGMPWPSEEEFGNFQAEMFKVRDRNDVVIGVASRLASAADGSSFIEWTVHLPARGTMYVQMDLSPTADGYREGVLLAGTRDFESLNGSVKEQFVAEVEDDDFDTQGRIVLMTALVSPLEELSGDTP
jgi:hypothetical protein